MPHLYAAIMTGETQAWLIWAFAIPSFPLPFCCPYRSSPLSLQTLASVRSIAVFLTVGNECKPLATNDAKWFWKLSQHIVLVCQTCCRMKVEVVAVSPLLALKFAVWNNLPFSYQSPWLSCNRLFAGPNFLDCGLVFSAITRVLWNMNKISTMISVAEVTVWIFTFLQVSTFMSYSKHKGEMRISHFSIE